MIWKKYIPEHRIYFRDSKDNWWTAGPNSPAGPSTEMFYDLKGDLGDMSAEEFEAADGRQGLVEIWNDVFMAYRQEGGGVVGQLPQKNVDTGAGLERVTAVMQGSTNIFDTDLFLPLLNILKEKSSLYVCLHTSKCCLTSSPPW
jgi:alanyl-tRNA synthetase